LSTGFFFKENCFLRGGPAVLQWWFKSLGAAAMKAYEEVIEGTDEEVMAAGRVTYLRPKSPA
jgi:hypothetical protein